MQRKKIIVCFGSGSAFVKPFANMVVVPTDSTAIVFDSTCSQM
jgi:hypothetical protein